MTEQLSLVAPEVPAAFEAAWRELERAAGVSPATLSCVEWTDHGGGYVTFVVKVNGGRAERFLCARDDVTLAGRARALWARRRV